MSFSRSPGGSKRGSTVTRLPRRRLAVPAAIVAFVLITVLVASAAAPPDIDTFTDDLLPAGPLVVGVAGTATSSRVSVNNNINILRDYRDVYVWNVAGTTGQVVSVNVTGGVFSHSQNSQITANSVLTYDGVGGGYPATVYNGLCSPSCVNLSNLGAGNYKNGFQINVVADDLAMDVRIKVYDGTNANKSTDYTFVNLIPGGSLGSPFAGPVYANFATMLDFGTPGSGGDADFSTVGAIEFEFIGKIGATDLTIDSITLATFDWGDLPETSDCNTSAYATTARCAGPRHAVIGTGNLYLGATIDPTSAQVGELNGQPTVGANGDNNNNQNDEDGVARLQAPGRGSCPLWGNGANGGRLQISVVGSGRLVGWIDFNGNGFQNTEWVVDQAVTPGSYTVDFPIPAGTLDGNCIAYLYARFRLFPTGEIPDILLPYAWDGRDQTGQFGNLGKIPPAISNNGEVEDYVWSFSPFGVQFASLNATAEPTAIEVAWETVSELHNQGFNVYRDTATDGAGVKLNSTLIPSKAPGSPNGYSYSYQDSAGLVAGQTYYYWIEDVSLGGGTTRHGPANATFNGPTAVRLAGLAASAGPRLWAPALGLLMLLGLSGLLIRRRALRS